ncbi:hypothetical protein BH09VER1_BH09VER1_09360 [soil metagenome]
MNMKTLASLSLLAAFLVTSTGCFVYERRTTPDRVVVTESTPVTTTRVVRVLPSGYTTTVYRGTTYYRAGGVYYRTAPGGYVTVERLN